MNIVYIILLFISVIIEIGLFHWLAPVSSYRYYDVEMVLTMLGENDL